MGQAGAIMFKDRPPIVVYFFRRFRGNFRRPDKGNQRWGHRWTLACPDTAGGPLDYAINKHTRIKI